MSDTRQPTTGGGLSIPIAIGAPQSELAKIFERFTTQDAVLGALRNEGIMDPTQPVFSLPEVTVALLTTTDNREFSEMFAKHLAWFNYLTQLHALRKIQLLEAENILDLIESKIKDSLIEENKLRVKEEKMSAKEIETKMKTHPDYLDALEQAQLAMQFKVRLDAHVDVADRNMKTISREVEIRKIEADGAARENNIGRFRRPVTR